MRRLPFVIIALSAVCLVGAGWLAVHSRWRGDTVTFYLVRTTVELQSGRGYAAVQVVRRTPGLFERDSGWHVNHDIDDYSPRPHLCGIEFRPMAGYHWSYSSEAGGGGGGLPSTTWRAVAPAHALSYPPLAAIGLVALGLAQKARKSRCRREMGLCRGCGYDLRAMPGQCPECGKTPESAIISPV